MVSACREGRTWGPCLRIGFDQEAGLRKGPHVFTYSAICDVPEETLVAVTAWLLAHRCRIGTRTGRRAGTVRAQAKLVLRWFRDDAPLRQLATEAGIGISTAYRYLHKGIDVIAKHAPDLHDVLARGQREGWSHDHGICPTANSPPRTVTRTLVARSELSH